MINRERRSVTIPRMPERNQGTVFGPETVDGITYEITGADIHAVFESIARDPAAVEVLADVLANEIKAMVERLPRPPADSRDWKVFKRHTAADKWPCFTYFGASATRLVHWHVVKDTPAIKKFIDEGTLEISSN